MKKFINWCMMHGGQIITALAIVAANASVGTTCLFESYQRKFRNACVSDNMWVNV